MLVLTRRVGEAILIDKEICLTVLGLKGHQTRLHIQAPKEISVNREEVHDRIVLEKALRESLDEI